MTGRKRVIDVDLCYGYETPERFSKAFARFHGVAPSRLQGDAGRLRFFLPLRITVTVQGGTDMDYTIETMEAFQVVGVARTFSGENAYQEIPRFWEEHCRSCHSGDYTQEVLNALEHYGVGELAVCMELGPDSERFRYMIAGYYRGGPVPEGLEVFTLPRTVWAKFHCVGPMPGALQTVNTEIYQNWLPNNPDYEMDGSYSIEWYSGGDTDSMDYESAIWLPVRSKA